MLRLHESSSKKKLLQQASFRHKVRNLRARVRAFLPQNVCCKHQRRTSSVMAMKDNLEAAGKKQKIFCCGVMKCSQEPWLEQTKDLSHQFNQLTEEEFAQIDQDKAYYLLDPKHIEAYDRFRSRDSYSPKVTIHAPVMKFTPSNLLQTIRKQTPELLSPQLEFSDDEGSSRIRPTEMDLNRLCFAGGRKSVGIMSKTLNLQDGERWTSLHREKENDFDYRSMFKARMALKQEKVEANRANICNMKKQQAMERTNSYALKYRKAQEKRNLHSQSYVLQKYESELRRICLRKNN